MLFVRHETKRRFSDDGSVETMLASNTSENGLSKWTGIIMMVVFLLFVVWQQEGGWNRQLRYAPYDQSKRIPLPEWTNRLVDIWEPVEEATDTPVLWDSAPRSGTETFERLLSHCLGLVLATTNHHNLVPNHTDNTTLHVVVQDGDGDGDGDGLYPHVARFVNVLTHNEYWIRKCMERGLLSSHLADVVTVHHVVFAMQHLFHRARGILWMRHPVKRLVDQYYQSQKDVSLEEFHKNVVLDNILVRVLNQESEQPITHAHLDLAKEIVRRKFLVGIYEWYDVSVVRMEKYFGWWEQHEVLSNQTINQCHYQIIANDDDKAAVRVPQTARVYADMMDRHWADVELYHYAKTLFAEQSKLL